MKLSKQKLTIEQMLLAIIADELKFYIWAQGKKKNKKPESIVNMLLNGKDESNKCKGFNTTSDFERYWQRITGAHHG